MKRVWIKRAVALLLFLSLSVLTVPLSVFAEVSEQPSMEEAGSVLMLHLQSNTVVCGKEENKTVFAGSTVKILSGLLFCEALANRRQESVSITQEMLAPVSGYHMKDLTAGDVLTVEQLLYSAVCGSYNDAYYILAYYLSGSVSDFVAQMNARSAELGAENAVFTDPTGIDDASRITAAELAKIAVAASQNELYMQLASTVRYQMNSTLLMDAQIVHNRNALISSHSTTLYYNKKCSGMSAGYTQKGGNCVVTVAESDAASYLCIVLGGMDTEQINYGYTVANRVIEWAFQNYANIEILSPDTTICTVAVTVSDLVTELEVRAKESVYAYLPRGAEIGNEIRYSIRLTYTELEAPVAEGTFVGYVAVLYQNSVLATAPLYTVGSAERSGFVGRLKDIERLTEKRSVRAGLIFFVLSLTAWIVTESVLRAKRRHKWDKYFSEKMALPTRSQKNPPRKRP